MLIQLAFSLSFVMFPLAAEAGTSLVDSSGNFNFQIPSLSTSSGIVGIISSPGTPSNLVSSDDDDGSYLSLMDNEKAILSCRGATMSAGSAGERLSLCTTSMVSGAIVLEGVTEGDVEAGLSNSRHARTLTALFRARRLVDNQQALLIGYMGSVTEEVSKVIKEEIERIFDAVAAEVEGAKSFSELYELQVASLQATGDGQDILSAAVEAAKSSASDSTLASILSEAQNKLRESGVVAQVSDPPAVARAFLACRDAYSHQAKGARAKLTAWKARVSRGLMVDGFGEQAETLLKKTLGEFDSETLTGVGVASIAAYRLELRSLLQVLIETSLEELFEAQVTNFEKSTVQKFKRQLLKQETSASESNVDDNAASMRNAAFAFETGIDALQIPSLGLTKDKAIREMSGKLADVLSTFPDSPEAQLKRIKAVKKTTSKQRKPSSRSVDLGLDLVAMIRPDGFGSLQGYAGYQIGGNSITVGVANDADDPQVLAQMGGVRPPLIRVQPKLRVDVEL